MSRKHNVRKLKLSRTFNQRKALIKGLVVSLIDTGKVTTTLTKAKVLKSRFDKLAARAQSGTLHARRQIYSALSNHKATNKLVDTIVPLMPKRRGGFVTIEKTTIRRGDAAVMATVKFSVPLPKVTKKTNKKK
ncbi:50S ribosomal protein L17 [Patescibacteria group bacterium]|nr:50S ribosomal protein L17 [Patescibacteria group bacterium]